MRKSTYSPEHERLCALLRSARRDGGLTQVEVAKRLDKPQSFVAKYETGERRLDLVELRQICQALKLSLVEFVKRFERGLQGPVMSS